MFKYRLYCQHRNWRNRPDPSGFGCFTFDCDDVDRAKKRIETQPDGRPGYGIVLRVERLAE